MNEFLLIFLGGGTGSLMRYLAGVFITKRLNYSLLTNEMFVNITGSFLVGMLFFYFTKEASGSKTTHFFITGFLGGYTTFSAFMLQNLKYYFANDFWSLFWNIAISLVLGLLFVFLGYKFLPFVNRFLG